MKVGPGFCPDFLRSATSRTRCWLLPKGSKIPPPQGQTVNSPKSPQRWLFWRYGTLTPLTAESGTQGQHCPHGRHQINNATMQVTPMVIFFFCKDAGNLQCRKDKLQCCNLHLGICQNQFLLGFVVTIPGMFFLA